MHLIFFAVKNFFNERALLLLHFILLENVNSRNMSKGLHDELYTRREQPHNLMRDP